MPQYYTGADPTQAFSAGMMAGYDFVDRIKARNEQVRLQKLQEQRDTERLGMQKEQFQLSQEAGRFGLERARTTATQQDTVFQQQQTRRPILEDQADKESAARLRATGLQADVAEFQLGEAKERNAAETEYGQMVLDNRPAPSLGSVGMQGVEQPSPPQAAPPAAGSSTPSAPARKPVPVDLREAQAQSDAEPGFIERGVERVKGVWDRAVKRGQGNFWGDIADTSISGDAFVPGVGKEFNGVRFRDVRNNLDRFSDRYLAERDNIPVEARTRLDATLANRLNEKKQRLDAQLQALPADGFAGASRATQLQKEREATLQQLGQLAKVKSDSAVEDAGITKPTSIDDPRVQAAMTQAATAHSQVGAVPTYNQEQLRLLSTQVGRISTPNNLTPRQIKTLTRAFAAGTIDATTLENWKRYGGPLAPAAPKIIPFGGGTGVIQFADGRLAQLDLGKGSKGGRGGNADGRFKEPQQAISFGASFIDGAIKDGKFDAASGSGDFHFGQMIRLMRENASEWQAKNPQMDILDDQAEFTMDWAKDPLQLLDGIRYYMDLVSGVEDPGDTSIPIENQERARELVPQTPLVER